MSGIAAPDTFNFSFDVFLYSYIIVHHRIVVLKLFSCQGLGVFVLYSVKNRKYTVSISNVSKY